ncbi:MAG: glycosyltransferase, partial [Pseudomonadales bacterium]
MPIKIASAVHRCQLLSSEEIKHSGLVEIRLKLTKPQIYLESEIAVKRSTGAVRKYKITLRPGAERSRIIRLWKDTESISIRTLRMETGVELAYVSLVRFPNIINAWIVWKRLQHHKRALPKNTNLIWRAYNQTFETRLGIANYQSWIRNTEPALTHSPVSDNLQKQLNLVVFPGSQKSAEPISAAAGSFANIFDLSSGAMHEYDRLKQVMQDEHSGLEQYFLFLTTDDRLAPGATQKIISELHKTDADILYTDEDRLSGGNRERPEFKPDWNPEYFFESNYTGRSVIFASGYVKHLDLAHFHPSLKSIGDILCDAVSENDAIQIEHIPSICLHRHPEKGTYRFRPPAKGSPGHLAIEDQPAVDILIPTRDKLEILEPCVRSILEKSTYRNYRISILDNHSQEPETLSYFAEIEKHSRVKVLKYPYPFNYSAINNFGASQSSSEILILLNNDIEVINPGWLEALVCQAVRPNIGCVGAKLYYPNGWIQHAGVILGVGDVAGHSHRFYPGESRGYMNRLVT